MGGYGAYVWFAYGVTALFLLLLLVWSWVGARSRETELEQIRKLSRAERRAPSQATTSGAARNATAAVDDGTGTNTGGTPPLTVSDSGGAD